MSAFLLLITLIFKCANFALQTVYNTYFEANECFVPPPILLRGIASHSFWSVTRLLSNDVSGSNQLQLVYFNRIVTQDTCIDVQSPETLYLLKIQKNRFRNFHFLCPFFFSNLGFHEKLALRNDL